MAEIIALPKPGEHMAFLGTTGGGKSVLAEKMLNKFECYFAIDTQDSLTLPGSIKITSPKSLPLKLQMFKKIRYVPSEEYRNRGTWDYIFSTISNSSSKKKPHPRVTYIDEIYHIGYGASFPLSLPTMATTARQRKLSLWISTQRPSMIPLPLLTECKRMFVFYLKYSEDLKKIGKFARGNDLYEELMNMEELDFSFIEIDGITGKFRHVPPVAL
jgi:hypothetical protein